jgi:hypothetical protein
MRLILVYTIRTKFYALYQSKTLMYFQVQMKI